MPHGVVGMWVLLVERIDPKRNGGLSTELINSGCNNKGVLNRAISWLRCVYKQPFLAPQPDPPASDLPIVPAPFAMLNSVVEWRG